MTWEGVTPAISLLIKTDCFSQFTFTTLLQQQLHAECLSIGEIAMLIVISNLCLQILRQQHDSCMFN